MLDNSAIAAKFLLKILEYFIVAELFLQTLDSCKAFSTIALLHADMHIFF